MKNLFALFAALSLVLSISAGANPPAAAHAASAGHSAHGAAGVDPDKAWQWLKNGNTRFVKGNLRRDGQNNQARQANVAGQHPHAILVSCSDSRVPPELVFDQKIGELFVVRSAGQSLDDSGIASIEYAVEHLGPRLIVVMGHESCGAVKAALDTMESKKAGSPSLDHLVANLHPHFSTLAKGPRSNGLVIEGKANVKGVAKDLVTRSAIVRDALEHGKIKIVTGLYRLGSGQVEWDESSAH